MSLHCEVCGGTNFIKAGNLFQCEGCGMKYSLQDVKALSEGDNQEVRFEPASPTIVYSDTAPVGSPEDVPAQDIEESSVSTDSASSDTHADTFIAEQLGSESPAMATDETTQDPDDAGADLTELRSEGELSTNESSDNPTRPSSPHSSMKSKRSRMSKQYEEATQSEKPNRPKKKLMADSSTTVAVGLLLFLISLLSHVTGFDIRVFGLSIQMWSIIIYAVLLVTYYKSHKGRIGKALTVLYWALTCLVCILQVRYWVVNQSFRLFKAPYEASDTGTTKEELSPNPIPTQTEEREPFVNQLKVFGEFDETSIEGEGDDVVQIPCWPSPCIMTVGHGGTGHFTVKSYDSNGNPVDLLINTTGFYVGNVTTYLDFEKSTQLEIKADGVWSITFRPMSAMHRATQDANVDYEGTTFLNDDVVYLDVDKLNGLAFVYQDDSHFSVKAIGPKSSKLLVNTVGEYSGTVMWNEPQSFFIVHAEGPWGMLWQ